MTLLRAISRVSEAPTKRLRNGTVTRFTDGPCRLASKPYQVKTFVQHRNTNRIILALCPLFTTFIKTRSLSSVSQQAS